MKKTVIILLSVSFILSCNSTKDISRVKDSIQYLHKIDSLKSVIEVLKMRNKTDSLQILLDFYTSKRIPVFPAQNTQTLSSKQEDVIRRLSGTFMPNEQKNTSSPKVFDKPNETGTFKDERDGRIYKWVKIGKQIWMAQNMNFLTHSGCWSYDNDSTNRNRYGLLYDFDQIKETCPKGWHVPTEQEWEELETTIRSGTSNLSAGTGRGYNASCLLEGGDSGFNILFGGMHRPGRTADLGKTAWFWTSTRIDNPIHIIVVDKGIGHIGRNRIGSAYACSLRCVKDDNNLSGTSLPDEKKEITPPRVFAKPTKTGIFKDGRDGQTYKWVKIGKQTWMAQNLNYMTRSGCWSDDNDPAYRKKYGLLYDFDQIKEACPKGWHVPTEEDWQELVTAASPGATGTYQGYDAAGLIEGGDCRFNILFGGLHRQGWVDNLGQLAWFWTSTRIDNPIHVVIVDKSTGYIRRSMLGSAYACSLRCVKDDNRLK